MAGTFLLPEAAARATVTDSLAAAASTAGRFFGAAAQIGQVQSEPALREALVRDCGVLTPEIHMKWDALQPARGRFAFDAADGLRDFARREHLTLRGHTLLWDQSTPGWAKAALKSEGWPVVREHMAAVLGRYDDVADWDVINEPVDVRGDAQGLRANIFRRTLGPDYIQRALEEARELSPRARLFVNDYGFDYDNAEEEGRRRAFLDLLERLKVAGAPLDAVGLQAHLDLRKGPAKATTIAPFLQRIADLGLDIVISELDVKEADLRASVAERDRAVAAEARAYLEVALAQPAVKGVITWGLSDRHSWLGGQGARTNRGLPYDAGFERKPLYFALRDLLATRA